MGQNGMLVCMLVALVGLHCARAFKIYKDRKSLMNILLPSGESVEERIYLERCRQSSSTGNCGLAIDGDAVTEWTQCSSTVPEPMAYWLANLETPSYITRVVIHTVELVDNQMVSGLTDFAIMASNMVCFRHISSEFFQSRSFPCDALADWMSIQSYGGDHVLPLCEVEVYGVPLTFQGMETGEMELQISLCDQSSVNVETICQYAIDKNFHQYPGTNNKLCAQTNNEERPWWAAFFQAPSLVRHVKIFNRVDCCRDELSDFKILVNEFQCAKHNDDSNLFVTKIFICEAFGSFLQVASMKTAPLTLCQVQIFGHPMLLLTDALFQRVGCFVDKPEDPDFELLASTTWLTPAKCHKICKRRNFIKFGLQNGQACFCGNKAGKHGKAEIEHMCGLPCKGDKSQTCGGFGFNEVYDILL